MFGILGNSLNIIQLFYIMISILESKARHLFKREIWFFRSSLCVNKFVDDGCIAGSALAVNSSYLATGSSEGVVNIYNLAKIDKPNPSPDKVKKMFSYFRLILFSFYIGLVILTFFKWAFVLSLYCLISPPLFKLKNYCL